MNSHFKSLIAWFAERHRRTKELGELAQMNDHQLRDIGLTKMDRRLILKSGKLPMRRVPPVERKRAD
jgi:uncharacterized protein YjiS (DUF1127 family)